MYGNYNPTMAIGRLNKQKEEIDNLIREYQQNMSQQSPVNNFINAGQQQTSSKDMVEWRILNENEEVDNLYVQNKTLFISDNLMVLKGVDGSLQKWNIKKFYPIDKKDEKISALEEEIKKLKEMIGNEHAEPTSTIKDIKQSTSDDDVNDKPTTKGTGKPIPRENK